MKDTIVINGVEYVRKDMNTTGRAVVVADRGWIFAGDVEEADGRIRLRNAVWVFGWTGVGFAHVIEHPDVADIRPISDVDIPAGAELFRIPVSPKWGLDV